MPAESKVLAITAGIFGLMTMLVFLAPFFLYSKNKEDFKREGAVKVIGDILFWHVLLMAGAIIIITAIDKAIVRPEFQPSNGIKYFYGNKDTMWDYWLNKDISGALKSGPSGEVLAAAIIVFKYISLFFYIICIIIPIAVLWTAVGYITGSPEELKGHFQGYIYKLQGFFVIFFGATFLVIIHMAISSALIRIVISDFSYYKAVNSAWSALLFGKP